MREPLGGRGTWLCLLGAVIAAALWRLWQAARGADFFADDAWYYVVIARNLASTGHATFDGITLTNGFHPLLLAIESLAMVAGLRQLSPLSAYLVLLTGACLAFAATLVVGLWVARRRPSLAFALAITASVLLVPRLTSIYLSGMESVLQLPLAALVLAGVVRRDMRLAGFASAAMVLARLDSLLYVVMPIVAVHLLLERSRPGTLRRAAAFLAPPIAVAGLCAAANQFLFGHAVPISGAIKSTFPAVHLQLANLFGNCEEQLGLRTGVLGAVAGLVTLARRRHLDPDLRRAGLAGACAALAQAASFALFQSWSKPTPPWYLAALLPMGVFAFAAGLWNLTGGAGAWARLPAVASSATLAFNLLWVGGQAGRLAAPFATHPSPHRSPDLTTALLAQIDREARDLLWAGTDCGKMAFWSGRRFVNLDGLVNDFAFQDVLAEKDLTGYFAARGIDRLVFGAWAPSAGALAQIEPVYRHRLAPDVFEGRYARADFFLYSHVHRTWSDTLQLDRERELWRSEETRDGPWRARLLVFDARDLWVERTP